MTTRRYLKYSTKIRLQPDPDAAGIGYTPPGMYEVKGVRIIAGKIWYRIAPGWVRYQVNGVCAFRGDQAR